MEHTVLAVVLAFVSSMCVIDGLHAYQHGQPLFENLQNSLIGSSIRQASSSPVGQVKEEHDLSDADLSMERQRQNIELDEIKESLETLAREVAARAAQGPLPKVLTFSSVEAALRQVLFGKGLSSEEVDEVTDETLHRMQSQDVGKRAWTKLSVQTRFAPFGTKLVPNRKLENGGATLLRYGRSAQGH